jgi:5-formyltetrahydrofolate cyclo-ligase
MHPTKSALRSELIAARARMEPDERRTRSLAIADRIEQVPAFREARLVALYAPLGGEVDASEIARRAAARGVPLAFPRVAPGERLLSFARCEAAALVRGPLGALEPPAGAPDAALDEIDCVVVPGVAFSEGGLRLGRGGGYYDVTLGRMPRAARIGLAFDAQIVAELPREPHDAPLDVVVTETRTLVFPGRRGESR